MEKLERRELEEGKWELLGVRRLSSLAADVACCVFAPLVLLLLDSRFFSRLVVGARRLLAGNPKRQQVSRALRK